MYQPIYTEHFKKQLKRFKKKYPRLKSSIISLLDNFNKNQGVSLGDNTYKLRVRTPDLLKGKNKSFRLIILVIEVESLLIPVSLYFKGDKEDMPWDEIKYHAGRALEEVSLDV